jgi:L-rhamnose mutarotase
MTRYCLALDLKDDPRLIAEYDEHHRHVWPEILKSIKDSGIYAMEIYRIGNRLSMIIEADESFSFEEKSKADANNPTVQAWEELMWKYQQGLPQAKPSEKWMLMKKIFSV